LKCQVGQAPALPAIDEDVGWLDITVNHAVVVQVREPQQGIEQHNQHLAPIGLLVITSSYPFVYHSICT